MAAHFNDSYRGTPPWDIGRPQSEFVRLTEDGEIRGRVLDVGCGTGENALFFAGLGLETWGLDGAPLAIEKATAKASQRRSNVNFVLGDALRLDALGRRFDSVTDCGLFHTFSDEDRERYTSSLRSSMEKDATYFMLCFSEHEPRDWGGPRRVSKDEIIRAFKGPWKVNYVREARFESANQTDGARAWLSSITLT